MLLCIHTKGHIHNQWRNLKHSQQHLWVNPVKPFTKSALLTRKSPRSLNNSNMQTISSSCCMLSSSSNSNSSNSSHMLSTSSLWVPSKPLSLMEARHGHPQYLSIEGSSSSDSTLWLGVHIPTTPATTSSTTTTGDHEARPFTGSCN